MTSSSSSAPPAAAAVPLLGVDRLHTEIATPQGPLRAVDGVSFELRQGATLGIVGESGCGKSMTALSIMGLLPRPRASVTSGTVRLAGRDLTGLAEQELRRIRGREVAMVFQDPMTSLHPALTIGRQIEEVLQRHLGLGRRAARGHAVELLSEVGMPQPEHRAHDYPHHLSGGMRQRAMIAIAIACQPKLLIADEPTTALDVSVQAGILDLLQELQRRHEMAILLITHDMGVVAQMADEVIVMYAGQVVEQAPTAALFDRHEHPYTEALLGALPTPDAGARRRPLTAIPGRPPTIVGPIEGCRFAPRCPHRTLADACTARAPELREIHPGHWVRSDHPASVRARATEVHS